VRASSARVPPVGVCILLGECFGRFRGARLTTGGFVLRMCARRTRAAVAWARSAAQASEKAAGRMGLKRGREADVLCAAANAGRGQARRATYAGHARPAGSRVRPAGSPRAAHRGREARHSDGDEGVRNEGIVLTGANDNVDGGRWAGVRDALEVPWCQYETLRAHSA
jgi:hypothetical protein